MQRALSGIVTLLITTVSLCNTAFAEIGKPDNNFIIEAYGSSSTRGAMAVKEKGNCAQSILQTMRLL